MADEILTPVADDATLAASPDTPVSAVPSESEVTTAVEPTTDGAVVAVEEKPFAHTDTPSLLNTPLATEDTPAPDSDAPPEPAPDTAPAAVEEPVVEPIKYELTVPEGFPIDQNQMVAAGELFRKHRIDPAVAQELVDFHANQLSQFNKQISDHWQRTFADTRKAWVDEVRSDPELGGAGHNTAMQKIFHVRDLFVPERDQKAFNQFLDITGAGDHPAFLRFIYRVAQKFDTPTPAPQAQPKQPTKRDRNKATMYDHPATQAAIDRNR